MNIKLMREISKYISEEPRRFQMGSLIIKKEDYPDGFYESAHFGELTWHEFGPCGTAACIAGTACLLRNVPYHQIGAETAGELLGITTKQYLKLFWVNNWPEKFREPYMNADVPQERVTIARAYIASLVKKEQERRKKAKAE